ncbi:MAG: MFS transporter [Proteobacteria bacterium]|nr:MFS transporter [Pseudomonadota bacterium]
MHTRSSISAPGGDRGIDVAALIDAAPWNLRQKLLLVAVGCAILLDGFDNQSLGLAAPAIIHEWGVSKETLAPILAVGQVGMMIGTAFGGLAGDRLGRKVALLSSVLIFALATALMSIVGSVQVLGVLRLAAGFGLGGALPNAAALVAEYTPARSRSFAVTATIVCVPLGGVLGGLIAATLLPVYGWRTLFAVAGLAPLLLAAILGLTLPESARFLLVRGADAGRVRRMLERDADHRGHFLELLVPARRHDTLALWMAFAFCLLAIYAAFSWLPTMLAESGYGLSASSTGLMTFNLGGVIAALAGGWLIGRMGSKPPMLAMAAVGAAVGGAMFFWHPPAGTPVSAVLLPLALLGGCVNGVQTTLYALAAHLYPVSIRSTGVGAASSVGRIGAISSAVVGAAMLTALGPAGFYVLMTAAMLVTAAALLVLRQHVQPAAPISNPIAAVSGD